MTDADILKIAYDSGFSHVWGSNSRVEAKITDLCAFARMMVQLGSVDGSDPQLKTFANETSISENDSESRD